MESTAENADGQTMSLFENVLRRFGPVWSEVVCRLTHRNSQMLCLTNTSIRQLFEELLAEKQEINGKLSKFVTDVQGFREVLRESGAVIAGDLLLIMFLESSRLNL